MSGLAKFSVVLALIASLPWFAATGYGGGNADRFSILCLGDILLVNEAERRVIYNGEEYPFLKIEHELSKYDFVFANLEAPVTDRGSPFSGKAYSFRMNPAISQCISKLKIDVVSISNNHLMDYGVPGLEDT